MNSRYRDISEAWQAYRSTRVPLVAVHQGRFVPAGFSDNPGTYYLVPLLGESLSIDRRTAIILFLAFPLLAGLLLGSIGWAMALTSTVGKGVAIAGTFIAGACALRMGDVYIFEFATPLVLIPWMLYLLELRQPRGFKAAALFMAGIALGTVATIRTTAALPTLTFLLVLLSARKIKSRALLALVLFAGLLLPTVYSHNASTRRDEFLRRHSASAGDNERHSFWHFAYIGLGFISNSYVPGGICDDFAKHKVQILAPGASYLSAEYSRALRNEVLAIVRDHPILVVFTLFAKVGVIFGIFAAFANVGLVAALWHRKPWRLEVALLSACVAAAAPLLILAPLPLYDIGLISMAVIYGIISVDHSASEFIQQRNPAFSGTRDSAKREMMCYR